MPQTLAVFAKISYAAAAAIAAKPAASLPPACLADVPSCSSPVQLPQVLILLVRG